MSMYIENNLGKDEQIVLKAHKSILYLVAPIFWFVVVLVAAIALQVLVAPYASPEGLYVQSQTSMDMEYLDRTWSALSEEEKQEALSDGDVISLVELMLGGHRESVTWEEYRKACRKNFEGEHRMEWEANKDELMAELSEEGGMRMLVANVGNYVSLFIWGLFLLIGVIPFLQRLLRWLSIDLALTNKRVVGKLGILRINALDFHIDKIDHVQIKASIFGNLFHYYSLRIVSVGGAGFDNRRNRANKDTFVGISNAQDFKDSVTRAIELHAEEARKAQAEEIARAMKN